MLTNLFLSSTWKIFRFVWTMWLSHSTREIFFKASWNNSDVLLWNEYDIFLWNDYDVFLWNDYDVFLGYKKWEDQFETRKEHLEDMFVFTGTTKTKIGFLWVSICHLMQIFVNKLFLWIIVVFKLFTARELWTS